MAVITSCRVEYWCLTLYIANPEKANKWAWFESIQGNRFLVQQGWCNDFLFFLYIYCFTYSWFHTVYLLLINIWGVFTANQSRSQRLFSRKDLHFQVSLRLLLVSLPTSVTPRSRDVPERMPDCPGHVGFVFGQVVFKSTCPTGKSDFWIVRMMCVAPHVPSCNDAQ